MENLGVTAPELELPTPAQIAAVDEDVRDLYTAYHQGRVNRLIAQVTAERSKVVQAAQSRRVTSRSATTSQAQLSRTSDLEQRQVQRLEHQHRREVAAIIQKVIRAERVREDGLAKEARARELKEQVTRQRLAHTAMVQERHLKKMQQNEMAQLELERKRQEELEIAFQKEQQRLITLQHLTATKIRRLMEREARRQATADRNRTALERIEEERLQRLREKELADEQRRLQLLLQTIHENELRQERNQQQEARKKKVLDDVRTQEEAAATERRLQAEEREGHRQEWHEHVQAAQAHNRATARAEHDQKVQRYMAQREQLDQAMDDRKAQSLKDTDELYARLERQQQEKDRERKRAAYSLQLKKEERDRRAAHVARQRQLLLARTEQRRADGDRRVEWMDKEKHRRWAEKIAKSNEMNRQKEIMSTAFREQVAADRASIDSIREIATKFGVDLEEIEQRSDFSSTTTRSATSLKKKHAGISLCYTIAFASLLIEIAMQSIASHEICILDAVYERSIFDSP
jgi:hypothetical protein